jgi:hypothetical protein
VSLTQPPVSLPTLQASGCICCVCIDRMSE